MSTLQENRRIGLKKSDNGGFGRIIFRYLPYWPLFLFLLILSIAGAWIYLRYTVPVFESTASILMKDEKKGMSSELMDELNPFGSSKIVENEIEILRSRSLSREVVKNLGLYAPITEEGTVISKSAYVYSPVHIEVQNPDSLVPAAKIYFIHNADSNTVVINNKQYPIDTWVETEYGVLRFKPNPRYGKSEQSNPMFFSLVPVRRVANGIRSRLMINSTGKMSTVLVLRLQDEVPARAEDILNELIDEYNKAAINDKNALAANTLAFVQDRLSFVVNELDSVESRIQQYKTQQGIVDISEQGKQFLTTVGESNQRASEIEIQLSILDQIESYVSGKSASSSIVPSTLGVTDGVLTGLLEQLNTAQTEYNRMKGSVGENFPTLVALSEQIERLKPSIMENIRNQRRNLMASKQNITSTGSRYSSMMRTIPTKERELLEISRQQAIKNNIYTFLLQKREETALSYGSTVPDSRLIDRAESLGGPVSPNKKIIYLSAIVLAFALGIGLILLKEVMNRNILFRSEIEENTSFPILGEISHDPSKSPLVISEGKRNYIAEQFRQLRTSLGYMGINSKKKKLLITSTISGEGKSFISANLGVSLALTGKKVVMLELDLRKPRLSSVFDLNREVGLSNFFIGEKEPDEIIKKVPQAENLFIIPSGPIPPNPSELMLNGKLQELLAYLDPVFDFIIIDTAPVSPVTDAYILSPLCDATLYVVRHGYTPKTAIKMLEHNNTVRELKNVGIVFNDVKARGIGKNDYGYGYGYGGGYGYGYEEETGKKIRKKIKKEPEAI